MVNRVTGAITGMRLSDYGCMLRAYARDVVDEINACEENATFIPALAQSFSRRPTEVEVAHAERAAGASKYSLYRLVRLNFDLMTGFSVVPLQIFTLFGNNIGPAQSVAATPDSSGKFPTTLAGAQVLVNGTAAPLLMVQAGEIHGVVPFGFSPPVAIVRVLYQNQEAPQLDEPNSLNPGIFAINGQAAILNQDGTINTPSNPAKLGSIVSIYATGTGPLATPLSDGQITPLPPPYFLLKQSPDVRFAGASGFVVFAGSAPGLIAGATQINVRLPATLPAGTNLAAVPVVVVPPGVSSPPAAMSVTQ